MPSKPAVPIEITPELLDRAQGALVGLAVGDALGATLEFSERDSRPHHTEMTGGGPFDLRPGEWTDDTAMALALANSLIAHPALNPQDLMRRFCAWWREGTTSCTGSCFDIGLTTREALSRFEASGHPLQGSRSEHTAGNGSLMRLAPVALVALHDAHEAERLARLQSETTHAAPQCLDACALFVQLLREAIQGEPEVLRPRSIQGHPAIVAIAAGVWRTKSRAEIHSSGYVADTLEAALWCVSRTATFEEALVLAVNLGQDSDTVGAVTGQLAGAMYGLSRIPERWLEPLAWWERLIEAAATLVSAPNRTSSDAHEVA